MSKVDDLFKTLLDKTLSIGERMAGYNKLVQLATKDFGADGYRANLLLGDIYAGYYGNVLQSHINTSASNLAIVRYKRAAQLKPYEIGPSVSLVHLYCRQMWVAYEMKNHTTSSWHIHLVRLISDMRESKCNEVEGKSILEILEFIFNAKSNLPLSPFKQRFVWLQLANYYFISKESYDYVKSFFDKFTIELNHQYNNELLIELFIMLASKEREILQKNSYYLQNVCSMHIKLIWPAEKIFENAKRYVSENQPFLAEWFAEIALNAFEKRFYDAQLADKQQEALHAIKELCAYFPRLLQVKDVLRKCLNIDKNDQLYIEIYSAVVKDFPLLQPVRFELLSCCCFQILKSNTAKDFGSQEKFMSLLYYHLNHAIIAFPGENPLSLLKTLLNHCGDRYSAQFANNANLIWLWLSEHLLSILPPNYQDALKCLDICKGKLSENFKNQLVHAYIRVGYLSFDRKTGKNLDIKSHCIDSVLSLAHPDDLSSLANKLNSEGKNNEALWCAEIAVRGYYRVDSKDRDRMLLEKIASLAGKYNQSSFMREKLEWSRYEISKITMVKLKKHSANKNHRNAKIDADITHSPNYRYQHP